MNRCIYCDVNVKCCAIIWLLVLQLLLLFYSLPQSTTQDVIGRRGRTCPRNESLHILWRKRKVLHHHLSWHHRWWNCDRLRLVEDSEVDVCLSDQNVVCTDPPSAISGRLWCTDRSTLSLKLIMKISPQRKTKMKKYYYNAKIWK